MRTESDWNEVLADEHTGLYFHISFLEAAGRRLRRNYCWLFAVQIVSSWGKISGRHRAPGLDDRLAALARSERY